MGKKEKEMRTRSVFRYKLHDYEERERKRERGTRKRRVDLFGRCISKLAGRKGYKDRVRE